MSNNNRNGKRILSLNNLNSQCNNELSVRKLSKMTSIGISELILIPKSDIATGKKNFFKPENNKWEPDGLCWWRSKNLRSGRNNDCLLSLSSLILSIFLHLLLFYIELLCEIYVPPFLWDSFNLYFIHKKQFNVKIIIVHKKSHDVRFIERRTHEQK